MAERTVWLPRSAERRGATNFLKLLCRINAYVRSGFDFLGRLLRPGARIPESDLWPSPEYPRVPLVLEGVQLDFSGHGHNRNAATFILWRYDRDTQQWIEAARSSAPGARWVHDLAPIARRLLGDTRVWPDPAPAEICERFATILEGELAAVTHQVRIEVLSRLHDHCAGRICAELWGGMIERASSGWGE